METGAIRVKPDLPSGETASGALLNPGPGLHGAPSAAASAVHRKTTANATARAIVFMRPSKTKGAPGVKRKRIGSGDFGNPIRARRKNSQLRRGPAKLGPMKIEALHIGMRVRHPQYGEGTVKNISEHTADVVFEEGKRIVEPEASGLVPAQTQVEVTNMELPLHILIQQVVAASVKELGLEKTDLFVEKLGARWHGGKAVMHPADPTLQTKEVPLETFFHKIVMVRNNLRVLEQKINAHEKLTDGEKVEMQQYITRSYGSLTTFNILFKEKDDQFGS